MQMKILSFARLPECGNGPPGIRLDRPFDAAAARNMVTQPRAKINSVMFRPGCSCYNKTLLL